jgi:hypothetical protein
MPHVSQMPCSECTIEIGEAKNVSRKDFATNATEKDWLWDGSKKNTLSGRRQNPVLGVRLKICLSLTYYWVRLPTFEQVISKFSGSRLPFDACEFK